MMLHLRSHVLVLLLLPRVAFSDGTVIACSFEPGPRERGMLEQFVFSIGELVEDQVDELAQRVTADEAARLREEQYAWSLHADTFCREVGRNSAEPDAEFECLSLLFEDEYTRLESELTSSELPVSRQQNSDP